MKRIGRGFSALRRAGPNPGPRYRITDSEKLFTEKEKKGSPPIGLLVPRMPIKGARLHAEYSVGDAGARYSLRSVEFVVV